MKPARYSMYIANKNETNRCWEFKPITIKKLGYRKMRSGKLHWVSEVLKTHWKQKPMKWKLGLWE